MLTPVDALLMLLALALVMGLPLMMLRNLRRTVGSKGGARTEPGELRASDASLYAAGFCLIAPLGIYIAHSAGTETVEFSLDRTGSVIALGFGGFATFVALWLVLRWRLRRGRFDETGLTWRGRRYPWSELTEARIEARATHGMTAPIRHRVAVARFGNKGAVRISADVEGRREFDRFLKKMAKRRGVRFEETWRN